MSDIVNGLAAEQVGKPIATVTRRRFLQAAGAGILASTLRPVASAQAQTGRSVSMLAEKVAPIAQAQAQVLQVVKATFEQLHPGVEFTYDTYVGPGDLLTKLETAAASHEGPDVFELGSTLVPTAYATGAFNILTADMWNRLGGRNAFLQPALTVSGPSLDRAIAVPEYANPFAMVYNTRMFAEAGIARPPRTWTEFVEIAQKLTVPGKSQWGTVFSPADPYDPYHYVWLFACQLGGQLTDATGAKGQLSSPAVMSAVAFMLDWMAKYKIVAPSNATFTKADALRAFANRQAAMWVMQGPAVNPLLAQSPVAREYAWAPHPTIPYGMTSLPPGGRPAQTFVAGEYLALFKFGKNQDLALDLVRLLTSTEIEYMYFTKYGYLPVTQRTYDQHADTKQRPWDAFYDAEVKAYPTPFVGSWAQIEVILGHAVKQMADQIAGSGGYTAAQLKQALTQADAEFDAAVKQGK
ncbi:MAG TPA: extracellular solute-binding protein [bacterium]|nr:extracellular solute-binding protein [bacterium]